MLISTLEDAVRTSVQRKFGDDMDIEVTYNDDTGEIEVYHFKIVTDDVANPTRRLRLRKRGSMIRTCSLTMKWGFG